MDTKAYNIFNDIYKNTFEQLKFAEIKNNILTTILIGVFFLFFKFSNMTDEILKSNIVLRISFFILLIILFAALYHVLKSFIPRLSNHEKKSTIDFKNFNIYFFGDTCNINKENFFNLVLKKTGLSQLNNKEQLLDISNQIIILSQITQYKHNCFRDAFFCCQYFFVLLIILSSCIYWS